MTMPMVSILRKMVAYCKDLPRIKSYDLIKSCDKLNILYLHLQKTYGQQTKQSVDLVWESLKANMSLRDKLKKLYFYFHKTYDH